MLRYPLTLDLDWSVRVALDTSVYILGCPFNGAVLTGLSQFFASGEPRLAIVLTNPTRAAILIDL